MKVYEVTFKLTPRPWYTGYAKATSKAEAIELVKWSARSQGFTVPRNAKNIIAEVKDGNS